MIVRIYTGHDGQTHFEDLLPHRDHWGRIGTDATAPCERRDDFVRKRIPGADTVDLAAYFGHWPG
jgi:4-hydroxybenzoate decarboxylase